MIAHPSVSRRIARRAAALCLAICLVKASPALAWEPGIGYPKAIGSPAQPLTVNTSDRYDVISFYQCIFEASKDAGTRMNWTGSLGACNPGTTSSAYQNDVLRRLNYYRAMAGIPADIQFGESFNRDAQAAALIMAEHQSLSHTPGDEWGQNGCWSAYGENGANNGNVALGNEGPAAVDAYILDDGDHNTAVGHRRWILFPEATLMGSGDVPQKGAFPYLPGEHPAANCLYVIDTGSRREALEAFAAWPPPGFVPFELVFPRWSLHYSSAVFGAPRFGEATVAMKMVASGTAIPVKIEHRYNGGPVNGNPTIVWVPDWSAVGGAPPLDQAIEVTVSGITEAGSGAPSEHTYQVTPIDPNSLPNPPVIEGPERIAENRGGTYHFTPLGGVGADDYEIGVATLASASWTEGAEEDLPLVKDGTSPSYSLRTPLISYFGSPGANGGNSAFHLAFPNFDETEQYFEIDRTVIVKSDTQLTFFELFRWATVSSRLSAEISADGGPWLEVWGRNGNGEVNTDGWLKYWQKREVSLGQHAGKTLRVRFVYRGSQSLFTNLDEGTGVFIDDITITDADQIGPEQIQRLPRGATSFKIDEAFAGAELADGQTFLLRLRPIIGCRPFPFGPITELVIDEDAEVEVDVASFAGWLDTHHPGLVDRGFSDDDDGDGLPNGAEYGLGGDPGRPDVLDALQIHASGQGWELRFDPTELSYATGDLAYRVLHSQDLVMWTALTDEDPSTAYRFTLPSGPAGYVRWEITQ